MSAATVNFHGIVSATAKVQQSNGCKWLTLEFRDEDGGMRDVTLFCADPQALLDAIAGRVAETVEAAEVQP